TGLSSPFRTPRPPPSTLLPYTTLFRSGHPGIPYTHFHTLPVQAQAQDPIRIKGLGPGRPGGWIAQGAIIKGGAVGPLGEHFHRRSEEHTSELQSRENLVCRLLLEKKKK